MLIFRGVTQFREKNIQTHPTLSKVQGDMGPLEMAENKWVSHGLFHPYKWATKETFLLSIILVLNMDPHNGFILIIAV